MNQVDKKSKEQLPSPFASGGSSVFSKKYLIYSAIFLLIMILLAALNLEQFRNEVNNASFPWEIQKD